MLNISKAMEEDGAVYSLEGQLDTLTAPSLEKELLEAIPGISRLTLDFEKLDYISSAGLRVLLSAQRQMNAKDGMKLVHVCEPIMEIFEVTGFSEILTIE